jgi:hypothetical protein
MIISLKGALAPLPNQQPDHATDHAHHWKNSNNAKVNEQNEGVIHELARKISSRVGT